VLVANYRASIGAVSNQSGTIANVSQDEVARLLLTWLSTDTQWDNYLKSKGTLPVADYHTITDIMSRHIAYDSYTSIIK
jgi:hypothetical protein